MIYFRVVIVFLTAIFMAYHSQIFIGRIEPNVYFSWLASGLIEAMLISLATLRTILSRILLIPLFLISVIATSSSYIVSNEQILDTFFNQKRVISQLQKDITDEQQRFELGQKYTTKTLQRERSLKDKLNEVLDKNNGDMTLINSLIFFVIVLIMQGVSIYFCMGLKQPEKGRKDRETGQFHDEVLGIVDTHGQGNKQSDIRTADTEEQEKEPFKSEVLLLKDQKKSNKDIGKLLGISGAKVSQILKERG